MRPLRRPVCVALQGRSFQTGQPSGPAGTRKRFAVHEARQPLPADVVPEDGFQAAVAWMVLLYLPDKHAALAHLVAAVAPGGVLISGSVPDEPCSWTTQTPTPPLTPAGQPWHSSG